MLKKKISLLMLSIVIMVSFAMCSKTNSTTVTPDPTPVPPATNDVAFWLTKADKSVLLQQQSDVISFKTSVNSSPIIEVDSTQKAQTIDGFGYTLTGSSAYLINQMPPALKSSLLAELFGNGSGSIGVSYLRLSIGASDLSQSVFTYDDRPAGQTDPNLTNFSLGLDTVDLIPVLKQILAINPNIKILGSPWSAPSWMKDNQNSAGGGLLPAYYAAYAQYFVKYIQSMKNNGIKIDAITIQNEPQNPNNNPSMVMSAVEEANFVKNNLGPAFASAAITTKIIVWDHNCDLPNYPITVLNDAAAKQYIDGSAFHLYAGNISALSTVHASYPDKNLYFTEQWTSSTGSFDGDLIWHIKNVIIGSMRNWSKNALEWNLANDPNFGPHTSGGCTQCKGAITINGSSTDRNVSYYIIAHASKFVPAGSICISSTYNTTLSTVAFLTPDGKKVLIVLNDSPSAAVFNIKFNNKYAATQLPASSVGTFIW